MLKYLQVLKDVGEGVIKVHKLTIAACVSPFTSYLGGDISTQLATVQMEIYTVLPVGNNAEIKVSPQSFVGCFMKIQRIKKHSKLYFTCAH